MSDMDLDQSPAGCGTIGKLFVPTFFLRLASFAVQWYNCAKSSCSSRRMVGHVQGYHDGLNGQWPTAGAIIKRQVF